MGDLISTSPVAGGGGTAAVAGMGAGIADGIGTGMLAENPSVWMQNCRHLIRVLT